MEWRIAMNDHDHRHPATAMLGLGHDPADRDGSLKPPLFPTSTFAFPSAAAGKRAFELALGITEPEAGEDQPMIYSRLSNPGLKVLEERVARHAGGPLVLLRDVRHLHDVPCPTPSR
jgi:cystathionine beta-lyase/cystathionine gamma-synthase